MMFDSGSKVSIIDTNFARKVDCVIDESRAQEWVGIEENAYTTVVWTTIKVTLDGSLVYYLTYGLEIRQDRKLYWV